MKTASRETNKTHCCQIAKVQSSRKIQINTRKKTKKMTVSVINRQNQMTTYATNYIHLSTIKKIRQYYKTTQHQTELECDRSMGNDKSHVLPSALHHRGTAYLPWVYDSIYPSLWPIYEMIILIAYMA